VPLSSGSQWGDRARYRGRQEWDEPADPISGQAWPFVGELQLVLTDDRTFPGVSSQT
jgi:hypothetical protein